MNQTQREMNHEYQQCCKTFNNLSLTNLGRQVETGQHSDNPLSLIQLLSRLFNMNSKAILM